MMTDGKLCPACGKDIGVWAIVSSPLPSLIRCPNCRTRLTYSGTAMLIVALIVLTLLVGIGLVALTALVPPRMHGANIAIALAALLAVWAPVEVAIAFYLRGAKNLRQAGRQYDHTGDRPEGGEP
jgi:hypothetical protein